MFNKACCLIILILVMLARRITSSPSLVPCNGCMVEAIDVLNNISNILAKNKGTEFLNTIAQAVTGQQATIKSLIQEQHKTLIKILQDHPKNVEEEAAGNWAKQIEQLSQRLETTKQEIEEEFKHKMELLQALKNESRSALDKVQSDMEAEISNYQKTSTDSIKSIEEKAAAGNLEVKAHIIAAKSKLQEIEREMGSTREQLKAKIDADRTSTLKKLEEGMGLVQETVQQLGQDLTSYKTTTQQTTSSLDGKVDKVIQDMASTLEKITSELKGTKVHCITETTQNKEQMQQSIQKMQHEYNQLKSEFQKEVDVVKAMTETAVKETKASFTQELESLKQTLIKNLFEQKVSQQTTTTTKAMDAEDMDHMYDYYEQYVSAYTG